MIRKFIYKDGQEELQIVDPQIGDRVSLEELVGGRFHRWKKLPEVYEKDIEEAFYISSAYGKFGKTIEGEK